MSAQPRFIGFMYVAKRECGRVSASAWDDKGAAKETAASVARWIKRGDSVERIKRYEGDPSTDWICDECRGKPCQNATANDAARQSGAAS